jgi:hypothetical protein
MKSEFDPTPEERAEENRIKQNRETIIKSLTENKYQSSRHLCINTGLSVDDVLIHVETDDQIRYKQVGEITVYFLKDNEPTGRLFNTGNNSFEVKAEEAKPEEPRKGGRQSKHNWTPELLETLAAENYSYSKAAKSLDCDVTSIRYQVLKNKENTDAWERGQKRFQKPTIEKAAAAETVKESPKPEIIAAVQVDPRFAHTLEHVTSNGHSRESIEKVKTSIARRAYTSQDIAPFEPHLDQPVIDITSEVNHPKHYNTHPSGIECIDVVEHMNFNLGNAVKYIWRADEKGNAIQDLEKAKWYVEREIKRRSERENHARK